jgi:putative membrane protein
MVPYDPKLWWRLVFSLSGTVLPAIVVRVVLFAGLTAVLWMASWYWKLPVPDPLAHQIGGVVLGLMIVLRTNSSYDRYWEGRKIWGGIVNSSRNLVRAAATFAGNASDLARLAAAFPLALMRHLRSNRDLAAIQSLVPAEVYDRACKAASPPQVITSALGDWVRRRQQEGKLDSILARHLDSKIMDLVDYQGACERILKTPIPFTYAVHIKHLLLLYLLTLPVVLVPRMDWLAIPAVILISFGLLGIEEAGIEIEDPFGDDPNDLPLEDICAVITRDAVALADMAEK